MKLISIISVSGLLFMYLALPKALLLNSTNYPEINSIQKDSTLLESIERGAVIYEDFCMQCHLPEGTGVAGIYPPLAQADYLLKNRTAAIYAVKYGLKGKIEVNGKTYDNVMPAPGLYDDEIADVMNYILNSWRNESNKIVTENEVAALKN